MSNKSITVKELLENIDARISHIEDISADNRTAIIKLVKQSNKIVEFLKQIDIEAEEVIDLDQALALSYTTEKTTDVSRIKHIRELIDEYMDKQEDLKEFEEELKKHKDDITPGQVGES